MSHPDKPLLVVVTGPTASGKTALAIDIARESGTEIISADSRQIYRDIPIITAAPTPDEQAQVRHHFVGTLPLEGYWSAARFESEALAVARTLFDRCGCAVVAGGSMMYIDALVRGIDAMPTVSAEVRTRVASIAAGDDGHAQLLEMLGRLDPAYSTVVDRANTRRVAHAVEICLQAGVPYSSLLTGRTKERPFRTIRLMIDRPRTELFERINARTDAMLAAGMEDEARRCYPRRGLNALNTVGFKEWFMYFDKQRGLLPDTGMPATTDALTDARAVAARIAKNTRVYAKKQLTWLARDNDIRRIAPADTESVPKWIAGLI